MARLKHYGLKGAVLLLGTRLAVTAALLALIAVPEVLNESARLLVLGAIVGHWLGHSGESDATDPGPAPPRPVPPAPKQREHERGLSEAREGASP